MAGFGMGNQGILGSAMGQQQQTPGWGGIFAAIQDAANTARGAGQTDNFSNFQAQNQQGQIRQQLLQGLTAEDPAQRQQAYGMANLLGIDTKPFQQQQATAALPKLLASMQPSTQNVPQTQAALPNLPGQTVQGGGFNFDSPGLGYGEALAQSGSPELQAELGPKYAESLMQQQAEANKPFDLSPGQHRYGANGQEIASLPEKPNFNAAFNSDGSPNLAYQKYTHDLKAFEQAPAWANVAIAKQKMEMAKQGKIDPEVIDSMADQALAGDKSVFQNLGRGQQGAENIARLRSAIMSRGKARGIGGADLASLNAEFSGLQAGERTLGTRTANVEMAAAETQNLIPLALAASKAVPRSSYPSLNKVLMAAQQGTGDENVVRLSVSVNGLVNTYARAISPTGNPTVSDKDHAREILDKAWSNGQFEAGVDQMNKEIQAARKSPGSVRGEFRSAISGHNTGTASVPDAIGRPQQAAPAATSLPRLPPKAPAQKIRVFNPATGRLE